MLIYCIRIIEYSNLAYIVNRSDVKIDIFTEWIRVRRKGLKRYDRVAMYITISHNIEQHDRWEFIFPLNCFPFNTEVYNKIVTTFTMTVLAEKVAL